MTRTITHLYDSYDEATRVVQILEDAGIPHREISIVGADRSTRGLDRDTTYAGTAADATLSAPAVAPGLSPARSDYGRAAAGDLATPVDEAGHAPGTATGAGASVGTLVGGGAGLLAGIGAMAIPGVGPVVAAGWLVATLTGAGAGAAAGGLLGSLMGSGTSESDAHFYAEGVRRGGALVSVRVADADADRVQDMLAATPRVDPSARGREYRSAGWDRFDPAAPPLGSDPGVRADPLHADPAAPSASVATQAEIDRAGQHPRLTRPPV